MTGARASGYELGQRLAADSGVTAVFVANDQMALGVLRAMHERGRRIPADVSVVGFDDVPEAAYFLPPLTTVRQDFIELGNRALRLMLQDDRVRRATVGRCVGGAGADRPREHAARAVVDSWAGSAARHAFDRRHVTANMPPPPRSAATQEMGDMRRSDRDGWCTYTRLDPGSRFGSR